MRLRMSVLGTALLTLSLAACGGAADKTDRASGSAVANTPGANTPGPAAVKLSQSSLGPILTDQEGRTLYAFTRDKNRTSNCADQCIATWPALLTSKSEVVAGAGLTSSLLSRTERAEGTSQATYGKWPLYYYAGDSAPGDVNGQGVDGVWFVVASDGKLIRRPA